MNDLIVIAILVLLAGAALWSCTRRRKRGCGSCGGSCSNCPGGCGSCGGCHSHSQDEHKPQE